MEVDIDQLLGVPSVVMWTPLRRVIRSLDGSFKARAAKRHYTAETGAEWWRVFVAIVFTCQFLFQDDFKVLC